MAFDPARAALVLLVASLCTGCPDDPPSTTGTSGSSGSSSGSSTGEPGSTSQTMDPSTSSASGSASGEGSSSSGVMADSTDTGTESSSGTTGPLPDVGCADGEREALLDDAMYPDIAACAGGWSFPGVVTNTPMCDRMGGDDGPLPDGKGCAIDDLCAAGWHLCSSAMEVSDAGIADCDSEELSMQWNGSFFATRQSGGGMDTCGVVGTNDVFGCGDIGFTMISGCAPLNRSTGNGCGELDDPPWNCNARLTSEAEFLLKESPDQGGALCCRN